MFHSLLTVSLRRYASISSFSKQLQLQFRCCVNVKWPIQSQQGNGHVLKKYAHAQKFVRLRLYYHIMLLLVESSYEEMWPVSADEAELCFCVHEWFCWVCDLKNSCGSMDSCSLQRGRLLGTNPQDYWDANLPHRFPSFPQLDWDLGLCYFCASC